MLVFGYSDKKREAIWVDRVIISYWYPLTTECTTVSGTDTGIGIHTWWWVQFNPIFKKLISQVMGRWAISTILIRGEGSKVKPQPIAPKNNDS